MFSLLVVHLFMTGEPSF